MPRDRELEQVWGYAVQARSLIVLKAPDTPYQKNFRRKDHGPFGDAVITKTARIIKNARMSSCTGRT